ncbi:hypothetical protein MMA231_00971 [Asticcacaulis sp. MM231]|uniref:hypothetical protein n=1 Tax=Asticcacaulis sp. MM231 TaxID=3157666 RepID=UPI0032D5A7B4
MNRRSFYSFIALAVMAVSAFLFADPAVVIAGISHAPALFATVFVASATAVLFFGGLTRHSVLAAVQTLFRVRDRAFRQEVLATV